MGMNLIKKLGYGLSDLNKDEDGLIDDPRISREALDNLSELRMSDYRNFLAPRYYEEEQEKGYAHKYEDFYYLGKDKPEEGIENLRIRNEITYLEGDELLGEQPGILLFQPYLYKDWNRVDDTIDYVEDIQRSQQTGDSSNSPVVNILNFGPYPFEGMYCDGVTGNHIKPNLMKFYKGAKAEPNRAHSADMLQSMVKAMGYSSPEEVDERVQVLLPEKIVALIEWSGLLTEEKYSLQLKPMIVTYWE